MPTLSLKYLSSPLQRLLLSSLFYDLCKGIASPLIVLLLTTQFVMSSWQSGVLLSLTMIVATVLSLPVGLAFDNYNRLYLSIGTLMILAVAVGVLPFAQMVLLVGILLIFMEFAAALFSIGLKAMLADYLDTEKRVAAFSYRYILTNVAFAVGPVLGVYLVAQSIALAMLVAASASLAAVFVLSFLAKQQPVQSQPVNRPSFSQVLKVLGRDKNLVLYTVGSFFNTIVHGRFTFFLSLLLLYKYPTAKGMEILSYLLLTNALVVIFLQHFASRYITLTSLNRIVLLGAFFFSIGLLGFSVAENLFFWCLSMFLFTIGEIFIQPAEYLYIDSISPPELKGSYFAAHNLASLGAAISPAWCGLMISAFGVSGLCYSLAFCILLGGSLCAMRPSLRVCLPTPSGP